MENVLNDLTFAPDEPVTKDREKVAEPTRKDLWRKVDLTTEYDRGCMFAGSAEGDGTVRDFINKLALLLVALAKNDNPSANKSQKVFDIVKTALELYLDTVPIKTDKLKDNARFVASVQGFVDAFVSSRRYEDKL